MNSFSAVRIAAAYAHLWKDELIHGCDRRSHGPNRSASQDSSSRLSPETLRHVGLIAGCGALFRILYQVGFKPFWSGDSYVYSNMFFLWTRHFYSTSYRPPLYALFLGLVQELTGTPLLPSRMGAASLYSVVYLQCVLGLTVALLVYASLRVLEIRPRIALAGGLAFSVIGGVCMAELLILTELLSLFFIALASLMFLIAMRALQARARFRWPALASGLYVQPCDSHASREPRLLPGLRHAADSALCTLSIYSAIFAGPSRPLFRLALLLVVSAAPLVLLWMSFTLINIGQFRLAIVTGVTRTEAVYNLFDRLGPEDHVAQRPAAEKLRLHKSRRRNLSASCLVCNART